MPGTTRRHRISLSREHAVPTALMVRRMAGMSPRSSPTSLDGRTTVVGLPGARYSRLRPSRHRGSLTTLGTVAQIAPLGEYDSAHEDGLGNDAGVGCPACSGCGHVDGLVT
jgi:hypothetical protein